MSMKMSGTPPVARFGHTMSYLPCNNSILIAGGKNNSRFLSLNCQLILRPQRFVKLIKQDTVFERPRPFHARSKSVAECEVQCEQRTHRIYGESLYERSQRQRILRESFDLRRYIKQGGHFYRGYSVKLKQ